MQSGESALLEASISASRLLEPDALEVRRRKPLIDDDSTGVAEIDLVAIWDRRDERPERKTIPGPDGSVYVDVLWIPASSLLDPVEGAGYMMLPHLLAESERIWSRSGAIGAMIEGIESGMRENSIWQRRIREQIAFGDAALKESSRNLDFPSAAVFYLQTAHSYYLTALADCLSRSVMSLLTRPMNKAVKMESETGIPLVAMLKSNLFLDADPSPSLSALERVHAAVSARSSLRQVQGLGERVRGHYMYSISPLELDYRLVVARALLRRGDHANANFYLRFWAYSLARCPMVVDELVHGRTPSFYVPSRPFGESVEAACPETARDLRTIFGERTTLGEAEASIEGTKTFREEVTREIRGRGMLPESSGEMPPF